jgi:hypothetical protein
MLPVRYELNLFSIISTSERLKPVLVVFLSLPLFLFMSVGGVKLIFYLFIAFLQSIQDT